MDARVTRCGLLRRLDALFSEICPLDSLKSLPGMRHPDGPRFYQRAEGSPTQRLCAGGDPSLRLKCGSARDDATTRKFKLTQYP